MMPSWKDPFTGKPMTALDWSIVILATALTMFGVIIVFRYGAH